MHISPDGKRYIGITGKKPEYRWNHGKAYKLNRHFYNAISKYGWDNFKHIIIANGISKNDACEMEQRLIAEYGTTDPTKGYNHSVGGECGSLGVKYSKEQLKESRKSRVYGSSWSKGKHLTEEHRRKISEATKGRKVSEESKQKMRLAKVGYKPVWAGKERNDEYRAAKSKPVICVETKNKYFGLMEAERQTGISHANISNCLKGKRNLAGGFHWRYA